jgi:hypothetical protein
LTSEAQESARFKQQVFALCLSLEPVTVLTAYFLKASRDYAFAESCHAFPQLLELLNPLTSPIEGSLQYYGMILAGKADMLLVLMSFYCVDSVKELTQQEEELCRLVRNCVLTAAAWIYKRHHAFKMKHRYLLAADPRLSVEARRKLMAAIQAMATRPCCQFRIHIGL